MTEAEITELHDRTVSQLFDAIQTVFASKPKLHVLRGAHWIPNNDFPKDEYLFDIVIVEGELKFEIENERTRLSEQSGVVTVIDVIDNNYEPEYYDKPDSLLFSGVEEYVIYDPTAERLRPNLIAVRNNEGSYINLRPAIGGTFFSSAGFRLDFHGTTISASPCGQTWDEEDLWECQRVYAKNPSTGLANKILRLEKAIAKCHLRSRDE